jgi:hypothetical protein
MFSQRVIYILNGGDENGAQDLLLTAYAYRSFWRACIRGALQLAKRSVERFNFMGQVHLNHTDYRHIRLRRWQQQWQLPAQPI